MNGRYRSLPALPMSNNCTSLALLKSICAVYLISAKCVSIIEIVLKIPLSNADVEDQKFEIMMTSFPCKKLSFSIHFC